MTWLVILAVGAGSFVFRLGPLLVFERISLSERGDLVVRYAGTAAIAALIAISTKQCATGSAAIPSLVAVGVAVVLAARGTSMLLLLVCGSAIYAGSVVVMNLFVR